MMGHREKLRDGDEHDAFSPWRCLVTLQWRKIKKRFTRRIRRKGKQELKKNLH